MEVTANQSYGSATNALSTKGPSGQGRKMYKQREIILKILNFMCQKSGGIIKKVTFTLITSKPSHLRVECFTDTTLLNLLKVLKCNVFLNAYHSLLNSLIAF